MLAVLVMVITSWWKSEMVDIEQNEENAKGYVTVYIAAPSVAEAPYQFVWDEHDQAASYAGEMGPDWKVFELSFEYNPYLDLK